MLAVNNFNLQLAGIHFNMLVLATIFITAGGYVINDYFDTKTDLLNRPEKVIVGKSIKRRTAMIMHLTLNIIGILFGLYISFKIGFWELGIVFMLVSGILWFYSTTYKRQMVIGNLIVALLTALVPFIVVIYEIPPLIGEYREILREYGVGFSYIIAWIGGFSLFAFMLTLIREIVKDIEDFEGDKAFGRNTIPVVIGTLNTKYIVTALIAITVASLFLVYLTFLKDIYSLLYLFIAVLSPLLYVVRGIWRAETQEHYHRLSLILKSVMLLGVCYAPLVKLIIQHNF
jgi:4-hydroxybenzoate polyprenyltransferase